MQNWTETNRKPYPYNISKEVAGNRFSDYEKDPREHMNQK